MTLKRCCVLPALLFTLPASPSPADVPVRASIRQFPVSKKTIPLTQTLAGASSTKPMEVRFEP